MPQAQTVQPPVSAWVPLLSVRLQNLSTKASRVGAPVLHVRIHPVFLQTFAMEGPVTCLYVLYMAAHLVGSRVQMHARSL